MGKNKFPSVDQWTNEIWYYSYADLLVSNKREQTTHTWGKRMNFNIIMLSERGRYQRVHNV